MMRIRVARGIAGRDGRAGIIVRVSTTIQRFPTRAAQAVVLIALAMLVGGCRGHGLFYSAKFSEGPTGSHPLHPPLLLEPLVVTGTLGEFRNGNFHYGLDFSTGGESGAAVHAIADGHVRQIMFGRYNIGYAVRIEHNDGRISRYGHLEAFAGRLLAHPEVAKIHDRILLRRDFLLNISDDSLSVRRGEIIGSSGETGIGYAHLHFEYLDRDGRTFLNPLRFGLKIPDRQPPVLRALNIAPAHAGALVNGSSAIRSIALRAAGPPVWNATPGKERFEQDYVPTRAKQARALAVRGAVEFQLDAYDPATPTGRSRLGLTEGRLHIRERPEETLFAFRFDRMERLPGFRHGMLFDRFRTKLRGGARYLYNYYDRAPGTLPFLQSNASRGRLGPDAKARTVVLSAFDSAGNLARVAIALRPTPDAPGARTTDTAKSPGVAATVFAKRSSELKSADGRLRLQFEAAQTFEDLNLRVRSLGRPARLPKGMQALSPAFAFERVNALTPKAKARDRSEALRQTGYLDFLSPIRGSISAAAPEKHRARPVQIGVYRLGARNVTPLSLPEAMPAQNDSQTASADEANAIRHTLFAEGRYHFRTRSTGVIAVLADRAAPEFKAISRYAPGIVRKRAAKDRRFRGDVYRKDEMRLFLRPEDVGSGLDFASLRVSVDGIACYTDHDPDRKHVEVFWPAHIAEPGDHVLVAKIRDLAGNRAKTFRYKYRVIE